MFPPGTTLEQAKQMIALAPSAKGAPSCDARDALMFRWLAGCDWVQFSRDGGSRRWHAEHLPLRETIAAAMAVSPSPDSASSSSVNSTEAHGEAVQRPSSETER